MQAETITLQLLTNCGMKGKRLLQLLQVAHEVYSFLELAGERGAPNSTDRTSLRLEILYHVQVVFQRGHPRALVDGDLEVKPGKMLSSALRRKRTTSLHRIFEGDRRLHQPLCLQRVTEPIPSTKSHAGIVADDALAQRR
jgi:hypothetical protein